MIIAYSNNLAAKCECRERPAFHAALRQVGELTVYKCSACGKISTWKSTSECKMTKVHDGEPT